MNFYSTETVCALTGANRANLRRWLRGGLISENSISKDWSRHQVDEVLAMMSLTAGGATLWQIHQEKKGEADYSSSGWLARRGDMLRQLELGSDRELARTVRNLAGDYSSDDFINILMKPLNRWLRDDTRRGAARRLARFHQAITHHSNCVTRASTRQKSMPLLLEVVSVSDETEIWLEAIRLSGQGFCVEIDRTSQPMRYGSESRHDHHLLWCGAGISEERMAQFQRGLRAGKAVMLSGPDRSVHHAVTEARVA
ncbi:hypothetical protein ACIP6T_05655 [Pantoea sp. NPDC088449]|uniref:Transcriptional regulator MlrA-like C-terminal domain-containing protein n=1 Tax=Candidatus Pantoea floridensis TaxID=1938870 RepID=A0A286BZC0_9GAMM|nr:hypothetical protein [Pantoea floridensis]PIF21997.1 hypothetical protein BX596_1403 [Enterobacteriaceae bacterium JKS000233]SOD39506.1 hypothetical protein SAMN06273570_3955 [Pantoea floridensis]